MKVRSRNEFRKALIEMLEKKPVEKISVTEILEQSGYSRSSFYRNYVDYYDFVESVIRDEAETLASMLGELMKHYRVESGLNKSVLCGIMEHVYEERVLYHMIFTAQNFLSSVTARALISSGVFSPYLL